MTFSIGDVVMLKSGGPALTITEVSPEGITVVWYADSEDNFRTPLLPPETLILFDDEEHNRTEWTGTAYDVSNIIETLKAIA